MFSEDEKKFIENLFYSILKTYDSFLENLNIKLGNCENYFYSYKYSKKKFLFFLFNLGYIMLALIYILFTTYYFILFFLYFFISCLILFFLILVINKINKEIAYFNRLGTYKFYKKKLLNIKKQIDITLNFNRTKEFNKFSEYKEYYNDIIQKLHDYISFFRRDDSILKIRIIGIWELIISTLLSIYGFLIYILIVLFNNYSFSASILIILSPPIAVLLFQLNPFLYDKEIMFNNEIQKELEIFMVTYESNRFPSQFIQNKLINHIYCGFKNFKYSILCSTCSNIFNIKNLSENVLNCPSCNNMITIDNLIIKINSFDLEFFCIKCGFLNELTIQNPFVIEYSCKNCKFQQGKYDFRHILPIIERLTYYHKSTGFLFSIKYLDNKLNLITYYDYDEFNSIIKIYVEDLEIKLLNLPFKLVKDLIKDIDDIRNKLTKGIKFLQFMPNSLYKYEKISQNYKNISLEEESIKKKFFTFLKIKESFIQEIGKKTYSNLQEEVVKLKEKCAQGITAEDCEKCERDPSKKCITKLFSYSLGKEVLPHCGAELVDCFWISENEGNAIVIKGTYMRTKKQYMDALSQIIDLTQRNIVKTIFFANNKPTSNQFFSKALNICKGNNKQFIVFNKDELIQFLYFYEKTNQPEELNFSTP